MVLSLFNGAGTWRSTCFVDIVWIKIRLLLAVKWISIASGSHQNYNRLTRKIHPAWMRFCDECSTVWRRPQYSDHSFSAEWLKKKMIVAVLWRSSMTEKKTVVLVLFLELFRMRFMPWSCFMWGLCPGAVSYEVYALELFHVRFMPWSCFVWGLCPGTVSYEVYARSCFMWGLCPGAVSCEVYALELFRMRFMPGAVSCEVYALELFHVRFMPWSCFVWGLCPGAVSYEVYALELFRVRFMPWSCFVWGLCPGAVSYEVYALELFHVRFMPWSCFMWGLCPGTVSYEVYALELFHVRFMPWSCFMWGLCTGAVSYEVYALELFRVRFMPWSCFVWGLCPGAVSCEVYAVRSRCGLTHAWSFSVCVRLHLPVCLVSVDSRARGRMFCSIDARNDGHLLGNQKDTPISAGFRRGDPTTSFNNHLSCIDRCLQFTSILPVFTTRAL